MKRVLLSAFLLGMVGVALHAQNGNDQTVQTPRAPQTPWAQVTVTPNPQGLPPTVNSYIAPWPLGTAVQDNFSYAYQAQEAAGNAASPPAASPQAAGTGQQISDPPPASGAVSGRNQAPPASPWAPPPSPPAASSSHSSKRVVVPSPVHYDRAGRRVIDPGWQDTLAQIVRSEREAAAATDPAGDQAAQSAAEPAAQEPSTEPLVEPAAGPARETIIVVPGPAKWRIRGILTVAKGMLALDGNDGVLWYLPGLDRYIGFIEGLDAGEEAILEGYAPALGSSQERYFQPTKLFLDDMGYDLSIPPYGFAVQPYLPNPGGLIREVERPASSPTPAAAVESRPVSETTATPQAGTNRDPEPRTGRRDRDTPWSRRNPPAPPAWQHDHTSPWAPPPSVLEFEMDYDSFWREDPAKQERRERDSREIWY